MVNNTCLCCMRSFAGLRIDSPWYPYSIFNSNKNYTEVHVSKTPFDFLVKEEQVIVVTERTPWRWIQYTEVWRLHTTSETSPAICRRLVKQTTPLWWYTWAQTLLPHVTGAKKPLHHQDNTQWPFFTIPDCSHTKAGDWNDTSPTLKITNSQINRTSCVQCCAAVKRNHPQMASLGCGVG